MHRPDPASLISIMVESTGLLYAVRTNPHLLRAAQITEQLGGLYSCISMSITALNLPAGASLACRPIIQTYQLHSSVYTPVRGSVCASFLHLGCTGPARPTKVRLQHAPVLSLQLSSPGILVTVLQRHPLICPNLLLSWPLCCESGCPGGEAQHSSVATALHSSATAMFFWCLLSFGRLLLTTSTRLTRLGTCLQLVAAYPFKMDDRNTQVAALLICFILLALPV